MQLLSALERTRQRPTPVALAFAALFLVSTALSAQGRPPYIRASASGTTSGVYVEQATYEPTVGQWSVRYRLVQQAPTTQWWRGFALDVATGTTLKGSLRLTPGTRTPSGGVQGASVSETGHVDLDVQAPNANWTVQTDLANMLLVTTIPDAPTPYGAAFVHQNETATGFVIRFTGTPLLRRVQALPWMATPAYNDDTGVTIYAADPNIPGGDTITTVVLGPGVPTTTVTLRLAQQQLNLACQYHALSSSTCLARGSVPGWTSDQGAPFTLVLAVLGTATRDPLANSDARLVFETLIRVLNGKR